MKDVRFYEELKGKNRKGEESQGNVVAIFPSTRRIERRADGVWHAVYDGVGAVQTFPNCPPASTGVSEDYLRDDCRRIREDQARKIHPQLFVWLDQED